MHPNPNGHETLRARIERDVRAIHDALADPVLNEPDADDLVLEQLPNGELGWLRQSSDAGESDDALYVLTDQGRRALAAAALFDRGPKVAEVRTRS